MKTNESKALAALKAVSADLKKYNTFTNRENEPQVYSQALYKIEMDLKKAIAALKSQPVAETVSREAVDVVRTVREWASVASVNKILSKSDLQLVLSNISVELLKALTTENMGSPKSCQSISLKTCGGIGFVLVDDPKGLRQVRCPGCRDCQSDRDRIDQQPQVPAVEVVSEEWVESWLLRETNEFAGFGMDDEDFHQLAKIVHALLTSRQGGR